MTPLRFILPILILKISTTIAQIDATDHAAIISFSQPQDTVSLLMNGNLDGNNTFTYPNVRTFQHMKRVSISNLGDEIVYHPRLVINNERNWFDINSLRNEIFSEATSSKERALSLWSFMKNNRMHYSEPDQGKEIDDPIKLLGVYGYGACYNISYATAFIASKYPYNEIPYREYSPRNRHSVKDILFDSTFMLIDPDIEVFYLNHDNKNIATYDVLANDKYLMTRTHHYGKAEQFNALNTYVANSVYEADTPANFTGIYRDIDFHTLDFQLRPGESLVYNWEPAKYFHHNFIWEPNAPPEDIGNGQFKFETNFTNTDLDNLSNTYNNISTYLEDGLTPNIHPAKTNEPSSFLIKITSPFVIVNGYIDGKFYKENLDDLLQISFSKDSITWNQIWKSNLEGNHKDSITFYNLIQPIGSAAVYNYFLKFEMLSTNPSQPCGIDSIQIVTDFQVSKFFLPSLQLGENLISYSDNNQSERNIEVKLEWRETSENNPPSITNQPIFPTDNSLVDSLAFTFKWNSAIDTDGIVDYEFMLSDRADMRFPLSPSFEVYTSLTNSMGGISSFTIPFAGMLNSNTQYYWKVRAKDSKGAWSEWSPVWSFTAQGPMPPHLKEAKIEGNNIILHWDENKSGSTVLYYEIHASNEAHGFSPDEQTLLHTTKIPIISIPFEDSSINTFYRIVAVDHNGSKSGPSNFVSIPYPHIYNKIDSLIPNRQFKIPLETNKIFTTDGLVIAGDYINYEIEDFVIMDFISKPSWIKFNEKENAIIGVANYVEAHKKDSIVVKFKGTNTGYESIQVFKPTINENSKPSLSNIDSIAHIGFLFNQTITATDSDINYGDYISKIEVIQKPFWLEAEISVIDGSINLQGIPHLDNKGDTVVIVKVYDALGTSVTKTYPLKILFDQKPGIIIVSPNPFGEETRVIYWLNEASNVEISIFNLKGKKVYGIVLDEPPVGINELTWNSKGLENGLYFIFMEIRETGGTNITSQWKCLKSD
ncbi:MAG: hypothetical protein ABJH04_13625 [Cyclobacteriaceae bacterium]